MIAGDSNLRLGRGGTTKVCKVGLVGGIAFAMDGNISTDAFDAIAIARQTMQGDSIVVRQRRSMADRIHDFNERISSELTRLVAPIRGYPEYEQWLRGDYIIGAIFAGAESGRLTVNVFRFMLNRDGSVVPRSMKPRSGPNGSSYFPAAFAEAIDDKYVYVEISEYGLRAAAERIVTAGIALAPDHVAEPVAVLELAANSNHTWVNRPTFCPE
ncbi:MAG TPA: hypothetical protein VLY24_31110 [Bryobacteraceae bacterium]|nr:hypothetical protein [Bryobacteraceae bacterium]